MLLHACLTLSCAPANEQLSLKQVGGFLGPHVGPGKAHLHTLLDSYIA